MGKLSQQNPGAPLLPVWTIRELSYSARKRSSVGEQCLFLSKGHDRFPQREVSYPEAVGLRHGLEA
jgi:hypothetical protein